MSDPYAIDAPFYDLIHEGHDDDVGLWLSFAGRTDLPVLEVGTGTGRISIALSLAGHDVVGIDPSLAMLAVARKRAEDEGAEVTLIEGRLQDLALEPDHYGLVLVPADVFLYAEDGEVQLAMLRALGPAMAFNGTLIVDLPGPALSLDGTTNGQPLLTWSGPLDDDATLDVYQVHEDDLALQTRWLRITYETTQADGSVRRRVSEHRLRYLYRFEAEYLLHLTGLRLDGVYGDYELGPFTTDSERMILVARRTMG